MNLDEQIASFDKDSLYDVIEVLKDRGSERTELVKDSNGVKFIRKVFSHNSKQGSSYTKIWEWQGSGKRLIHCPKIIDLYEYGQSQVVILEYVEGQTLDGFIKSHELTNDELDYLFSQICDACYELHGAFDKPMIHRDLKPTNIIVGKDGVSIIDFGIARFARYDLSPDTTQLGTPSFAPPEQYGFGETCVESDIYALGMILYFMLTKKIASHSLRDLDNLQESVDSKYLPIMLKATEFDPLKRYHSALEMKKAVLMGKKPQNSARKVGGRVWNVFILLAWVILMFFGIIVIYFAGDDLANYPHYKRVIIGFGMFFIPFSMLAFALIDKSRLETEYSSLQKVGIKQKALLIVLAIIIFFATAIVV